jgi:TusA-related sulfurtransferase
MMENDSEVVAEAMKFESVLQVDVPKGRDGKHKQIITQLLAEIAKLNEGAALKIPLSQLPDTKENIRSALSRAARQEKINLATSSNAEFLFVWKTDKQDR